MKIKVYNIRDAECALCGVVSEYVFKIGEISIEKRATIFCPCCANLVDRKRGDAINKYEMQDREF